MTTGPNAPGAPRPWRWIADPLPVALRAAPPPRSSDPPRSTSFSCHGRLQWGGGFFLVRGCGWFGVLKLLICLGLASGFLRFLWGVLFFVDFEELYLGGVGTGLWTGWRITDQEPSVHWNRTVVSTTCLASWSSSLPSRGMVQLLTSQQQNYPTAGNRDSRLWMDVATCQKGCPRYSKRAHWKVRKN